MPILADVGIAPGHPEVFEVHNTVKGAGGGLARAPEPSLRQFGRPQSVGGGGAFSPLPMPRAAGDCGMASVRRRHDNHMGAAGFEPATSRV
jgi:hypothetical protein